MKQIPDVDMIYSCRKFFGVPDGAYLYTPANIIEKYECDYSYDRMTHILGRYELGAEKFYEVYTQNEKNLMTIYNAQPVHFMGHDI